MTKAQNHKKAQLALNLINTYEEFSGPDHDAWCSGYGVLPTDNMETDFGVAVYCRAERPPGKPDDMTVSCFGGIHKVKIIYVENFGEVQLEGK
jgi:hypothetical protein